MRARILGIGRRDLAPGGTPAGQSTAGIALRTAVGDMILVAEHPPEVLCDVGSTVPAGGGLVALGDEFQHADHPLVPRLFARSIASLFAPSEYRQVSSLTSKVIMAVSTVSHG